MFFAILMRDCVHSWYCQLLDYWEQFWSRSAPSCARLEISLYFQVLQQGWARARIQALGPIFGSIALLYLSDEVTGLAWSL